MLCEVLAFVIRQYLTDARTSHMCPSVSLFLAFCFSVSAPKGYECTFSLSVCVHYTGLVDLWQGDNMGRVVWVEIFVGRVVMGRAFLLGRVALIPAGPLFPLAKSDTNNSYKTFNI